MKRLDDGKVSLVEFLRSIKFAKQSASNASVDCHTHFAHLNPRTRSSRQMSSEDSQLIRSAN